MKSGNLVSIYQGASALESLESSIKQNFKVLKKHEIRNLKSFCDIMRNCGCKLSAFDGYFVGYSIGQIGKEFDLLRFGDESIINIEIKSELKVANKEAKILRQMKINFYYLKFLRKKTKIFTYIENDGFYEYEEKSDTIKRIDEQVVATYMRAHTVNYSIDPDREFVPSNYLISPFNSTDKFLQGKYFLTTAQQKIKEEICCELASTSFIFFSISANAGTGKTLLMYDIAKELKQNNRKIGIIHCGILNDGHMKLTNQYGWNIVSIKAIQATQIDSFFDGCQVVFIDEAQRINILQLKMIIKKSIQPKIPLIFSYDTKQYLRNVEGHDIEKYIQSHFPDIPILSKKLTNKIRTNKAMASFITNLFNAGKSQNDLNYECITIEYMDDLGMLSEYVRFLEKNDWTLLTFTTSSYNPDPYDLLASIGGKNAHNVIGQEFSKVVLVMNENFRYNESGKLESRTSYYSAQGMLYQIVTRVINELKIVVLNNPKLYMKLLEIKAMGE